MKYRYTWGETTYEVQLERHGEGYRAAIDGKIYDFELLDVQPGAFTIRLAGPPEEAPSPPADAGVSEGPAVAGRPHVVYWGAERDAKWLSSHGCTYRLARPRPGRARSGAGAAAGDTLVAPMPAQVRAVNVAEGDTVEAGQTLLLLEAMKMEIRLTSPRAARVARLLARPGDTVERDQVLVELGDGE
jgi:biotin carboxyl carrier protein